MEEQVINFKTAKLAKEKGFSSFSKEALAEFECVVDECYINKRLLFNQDGFDVKHELVIEAPTQSLLQKWLRDEHNIHIDMIGILNDIGNDGKYHPASYSCCINYFLKSDGEWAGQELCCFTDKSYTYEQALETALQYALKLIGKSDKRIKSIMDFFN